MNFEEWFKNNKGTMLNISYGLGVEDYEIEQTEALVKSVARAAFEAGSKIGYKEGLQDGKNA